MRRKDLQSNWYDRRASAAASADPIPGGPDPGTALTSISSAPNVPPEALEASLGALPLIKYINAHARGYVSHLLTRELYTIRCFMVDTALEPTSQGAVDAEHFIDAGVPGLRPAP